MPPIRREARASPAARPGCHRFDVCTAAARSRIFLHEPCAGRAAFDLHLACDHLRAFDPAIAPMVAAKAAG